MTKSKQQYYTEIWCNSKITTLYDAYKNPSYTKRQIWRAIELERAMCHGCSLSILTYNTHYFTAGYTYYNSNNGSVYLVVHTPTERVEIDITFL